MTFYGMHSASVLDLLLNVSLKLLMHLEIKRLRIVQQNHYKKYALDFITTLKKCHEL